MTRSPLRLTQILCPTDFSVFSAQAFRHALALAQQFGGRVKVLHVLPLLPNVGGSPLIPVPMFPLPEHRQHAENELKQFVEGAAGSGVSVTNRSSPRRSCFPGQGLSSLPGWVRWGYSSPHGRPSRFPEVPV